MSQYSVEVILEQPYQVQVDLPGIEGPPGPQGPRGAAGGNFTQAFTATATITVTHGLGKYPSVTVVDSAGDTVDGDVVYLDANNLTVSFSSPFSGTVICN